MKTNGQHIPVLLNEAIKYLAPSPGNTYLDATAGFGGHAKAILARTNNPKNSVLIDRDKIAIEDLRKQFERQGVKIIQSDFYSASTKLLNEGKRFDIILADLGVSSPHLNTASRGFSFNLTGPLDMRMDQTQPLTAGEILNFFSESDIERILKQYGEEPKAKRIARLIVKNRPIHTTTELATMVTKAWPGYRKTHPATRTFQALRIAVNNELEIIRMSLPVWVDLLTPGGRLGIITFHSLEDRIVKQFFSEKSGDTYDAELKLLTRKPITSSQHELVLNPRARSAKLRAVAKIKI
jgi:16S rRNA (cytosine1402-N4)-methyltransferase